MTQGSPGPITQPKWDRTLWVMILASGAAHVVFVALVVLIPHSFTHRPPALKSYTVDLIAPDHIGGNNIIAGGKGRVEGAPMAAAPKVEPPKPPPPKVEEPKPPEPKPEPQKVEPPKPEPPQEAAKPEPKPEPPKAEPKPKEDEAVLAQKAKKAAPSPQPTAAKPAPSPQAKPAPSPQAVAKAEAAKPQTKPAGKPDAANKAAKEAAAAHELDERVTAAVKRVETQVGKRGGGSGTKVAEQPGGPISVGPGEGAGGDIKGIEYLLYYNQMISRIKQVWAWAGTNRAVEASVRFNISESGAVVNVRISHPSGDPSYDASVERAIRAANPLSPPPEAYRKEFSDVELVFRPDDLKM